MTVIQYTGASRPPLESWLLKTAIDMSDEVDPSWHCEIEVVCEGHPCGDLEAYQLGCEIDPDTGEITYPDYGEGKGADVDECREFTPFCTFLLVATEKCSIFGNKNFAQTVMERAEEKLLYKERKAIESILWGALDAEYEISCSFAQQGEAVCVDEETDMAICVDVCSAIAQLEHELFCCTDTPYIHVPAGAINYMMDFLEKDEDGCLRTCLGSYVIPGIGYDGSPPICPDDPDAPRECCQGTGVIYGTGPIKYLRGPLCYLGEGIEGTHLLQNEVVAHVERGWGFWIDPCCGVKAVQAQFCK